MFPQTILLPVLAIVAFASAFPLDARKTCPKPATCPTLITDATCRSSSDTSQFTGFYFAIPTKNYLYKVQCNTRMATSNSQNIQSSRALNLMDCASQCDTFTDNSGNQICVAANFTPGKAAPATNCDLLFKGFGDLTSIGVDGELPGTEGDDSGNGIESVLVTSTRVDTIVPTDQVHEG